MLVLVALVSFLVQVYSLGYLSDETPASLGRYYAYQSLFAFSMMGLVLAPNFVQLFICWELVGLCSYLLIGYWYTRPEAARAAVKAFWITKAADVGFLIGIVLLWRQTGTFDFLDLLQMADAGAIPLAGLGVITFCIYLGASGKSAQFPFHIWLPDAMEGPTPVSALIHAATMVTAGVYLLTRTVWLFRLTPDVMQIIAWNGAFTALLAAVLACVQTDIKRVLAYSTVSQLGYMMAAIGAGFASAGFLHLLTHGIFKALLFLGRGRGDPRRGHQRHLRRWAGSARRMPQTAIVFVVGTLSLAGMPFFAGFFSKEEILGAALAGRIPRPLRHAALRRLPHRLLHVPRGLHHLLRTPAPAPRWPDDHHAARRASVHGGAARGSSPSCPWASASSSPSGIRGRSSRRWAGSRPPRWWWPWRASPSRTSCTSAGPISADTLADRLRAHQAAAAFSASGSTTSSPSSTAGSCCGCARLVGWVDRYLVDGILNVLSRVDPHGGRPAAPDPVGARAQDYVYGIALGVLLLLVWMRWPR